MKDPFKDRMKKYIEEINGITTEGNRSRANITTSHYVKSTSFFETLQQQTYSNVIPLPKSRAQSPMTTKCYSSQKYGQHKIRKKIDSTYQDCFKDYKLIPCRNPIPFNTKHRNALNNIERDILSMSPTHRIKKEYCLSDIMKNSNDNTNKLSKGIQKQMGSFKEVAKRQDEMNMKQFMTNFSNPTYLKSMCDVLKNKNANHLNI